MNLAIKFKAGGSKIYKADQWGTWMIEDGFIKVYDEKEEFIIGMFNIDVVATVERFE